VQPCLTPWFETFVHSLPMPALEQCLSGAGASHGCVTRDIHRAVLVQVASPAVGLFTAAPPVCGTGCGGRMCLQQMASPCANADGLTKVGRIGFGNRPLETSGDVQNSPRRFGQFHPPDVRQVDTGMSSAGGYPGQPSTRRRNAYSVLELQDAGVESHGDFADGIDTGGSSGFVR
jgi:hypothetical protein